MQADKNDYKDLQLYTQSVIFFITIYSIFGISLLSSISDTNLNIVILMICSINMFMFVNINTLIKYIYVGEQQDRKFMVSYIFLSVCFTILMMMGVFVFTQEQTGLGLIIIGLLVNGFLYIPALPN